MSTPPPPPTTTTFGRNSSCPTSIHSNNQSNGIFNQRRCSSTIIHPSSNNSYLTTNSRTLDRQIDIDLIENLSWIERCKQHVTNILKQISKPTVKQGK